MKKTWPLLIALIAMTVLVAGCAQYGGQQGASGTGAGQSGAQNASAQLREITIEAFSFGFRPATISLNKGETVRLKIINKDVTHTLTIDQLGINIPLPAGQTVVQDITPSVSGTFQLYCAVPGHRAAGMVGTATVTE